MEPQINYQASPEGPYNQKIYGKKKSGFKGCAIISIIIVLIVLGGTAILIYELTSKVKQVVNVPGLNFGPPKENPDNVDKRFSGTFMDAEMLPQSDGSVKLMILTDASVKYMLKQKSTGRFSMGLACNDCKTIAYIFDPAGGKVLKQTTNTFSDIIRQSYIVNSGNKIYQFTNPTEKDGPRINIYDAESGDIISDTKDFVESHPELNPGIIDLTFHENNETVTFNTKDGRKWLVYDPVTDKIYEDETKMNKSIGETAGGGSGILYVLREEKNDSRRILYRVTASKKDIITRTSTLESYVDNTEFLKDIIPDAVVEKAGEKKYLEGVIYYQDEDYAVIIYADQAGKKANRLVTAYDKKTGKELWTLGPDVIFAEMKIDESNSSSLSTRDFKIRVKRSGSLMTLSYLGAGIMAIDPESGKKLWQIDIHM